MHFPDGQFAVIDHLVLILTYRLLGIHAHKSFVLFYFQLLLNNGFSAFCMPHVLLM